MSRIGPVKLFFGLKAPKESWTKSNVSAILFRMSSRRIAAVAFGNYFFLFVSYAILTPYLQLFLKARGLPPSQIGILLGILELAGVAGPLVLGRLADQKGIYRALLVACLCFSVAVFIPMQVVSAFPIYLVCIVALGVAYRATTPLLDGLVSRSVPDPVRQYGRLRMAGSLGFIAISLFLQFSRIVTGDASLPILVAFGVAAVCSALAVSAFPAVPRRAGAGTGAGGSWKSNGLDSRFWAIILAIFLGRFAMGAYYSFFSLYLRQYFPQSGVSLFWAIGPLAEMFTIWFSGSLIQRWGLRTMFIVSLTAISVRLGLFVIAPSIVVVGLAQLLHAFTFGTFHTAAVGFVNRVVVAERRATGMAIYNAIGAGLPSFLASIIGGYVLQAHGFATLFVGYAIVPLVGILVLVIFGKRLLPLSARQGVAADG
jgi:MFS transporter, PPP family, 3-phenylpropionic acid transporter